MKLIYGKDEVRNVLLESITKNKFYWSWIYYMPEDNKQQGVAMKEAEEDNEDNIERQDVSLAFDFFESNRERFSRLYIENQELINLIKNSLSDLPITPNIVRYRRRAQNENLHAKVYFFGDRQDIHKCKTWEAYVGSHNIQFENNDGELTVASPSRFETLTKFTSKEDPEMLEEFASYFDYLDNWKYNRCQKRKGKVFHSLPEDDDYKRFLQKHEEDLLVALSSGNYSSYGPRNVDIFKMRYLSGEHDLSAIANAFGLSKQRISQIIKKVQRILVSKKFRAQLARANSAKV